MRRRYHNPLLLILLVFSVGFAVSCSSAAPERNAIAKNFANNFVVLDAESSRALVWETRSNRIGLASASGVMWSPSNLRSRYSSCVADCTSVVFSSDVADWASEEPDSDPVEFPLMTGRDQWDEWKSDSLKRRVLSARSATEYIALLRSPSGETTLEVASGNSSTSLPWQSPFVQWAPFPQGGGGLAYERNRGGGYLYSVTLQGDTWSISRIRLPFKIIYACGSRDDNRVVVVGQQGAFRLQKGNDPIAFQTDLQHVGECYISSAGVVLVERSVSSSAGPMTRARLVSWSNKLLWQYESARLQVAANPNSPDVYVSGGGPTVVRLLSDGTEEALAPTVAGVGYDRAGQVILIGQDGAVLN